MTDLAVKVILTSEGAQLTSGARVAEKDIDRVTDAARKAGVATSELAKRTNTASSAMQAETRSAGQASKAINDQVESIKRLALAEAELARNKRLDAFIRRDGFDPAVIRRGAQDIVDAKNAARGELGNRASGTDVRSRAGEILEANALAKATANLGEASRGATGAQAALGGAAADTAGRLGGLRGAAGAAASEIAAAAGVSEGALASLGGLGVAVGVAGAAVVGLGAIFVGGVVLAQNYQDRVDGLSKAIAFAGQSSSLTAEQSQQDAARTAAVSGQAYGEILDASTKLVVANQNSAAEVANLSEKGALLANTFGIDVATATSAVAGQFNALGNGDVANLNSAFAFLDEGTRRTIESLVEAGRTADGQALFMSALSDKVDGGPGSVTTAFGNAAGAIVDWAGALLNSFGPIQAAIGFLKRLAGAAQEAAAAIRAANSGEAPRNTSVVEADVVRLRGEAIALKKKSLTDTIGIGASAQFSGKLSSLLAAKAELNAARARDRALSDQINGGLAASRRAESAISVGPVGTKFKGFLDDGRKIARDAGVKDQREIDRLAGLYADKQIRAAGGIKQQREEQRALAAGSRAASKEASEAERQRKKAAAELAKETREAEAAARAIESALGGLARKYDPVLAATKDYEATLREIAELEKAGIKGGGIDKARADQFRAAAKLDFDDAKRADLDALNRQYGLLGDSAAVYAKALREIAALEGRSVADGGIAKFEGDRLREAAKQEKIASDIGKIFAGRLEDAGTKGAKAFRRSGRDAVEDIAALFGDRIGSKAEGLLRILKNGGQAGGFGDGLNQLGKDIVKPLKDLFEDIFGDSGNFAKSISGAIDTVLKGIQFGTGVTNLLGVRGSKTGAGIGSLAGKGLTAATGIPGLDAVGSVIGSFIGGALKKAKTGSSSLSFEGGELGAGKATGNSSARKRAAESATGDLAQRLSAIAEQLGGVITGNAAVSIGFRKGSPVVDTEGRNRTKGAGVVKFGKDDQEGAFAFAAANAIADGVIGGLSDKVAAALRSSTDIDRAIREATKVDALESLLDGLVGGNAKALREFEAQAKDRLRIATQFGFDVVKVEAANAKERKSLITQSLDEAVGGLREILESFKTGDRATGSLSDRRDALISERDVLAQTAGTDREAADRLARVIAQIDDISLEAFGTAGGQFASDRATNTNIAQRIVDQANAEITAASAKAQGIAGTGTASTDALIKASNERLAALEGGLNELTDLTVEMVSALNAIKSNTVASVNASDPFAAARSIGANVLV